MSKPDQHPSSPHGIVFFVDEERFTSDTATLTPRQILVDFAKEDPALTTLKEKRGPEWVPLTELDTSLTVKNGTKFVVIHNTPTTVS